MSERRSVEEIEKEIAALIKLKPLIPSRTAFGDDNRAAIDAEIMALQEDWDEDDAYNNCEDDEHARDAAIDAILWANGEDDDDMAPSEGWEPLVWGKK